MVLHNKRRLSWSRRPLAKLVAPALAACLGFTGCSSFFDDITSKEFKFDGAFKAQEPPLVVLANDTDGDHRAKALRRLAEPLANGGSQQDQDTVVEILVTAASKERFAICRLAAIQQLAHYHDPRAAAGLKDAYYHASSFLPGSPEKASAIRCTALTALGENGNPDGVELLVKVLREPPVEGPDSDRQQKMDERTTAARALGKFKVYQATEALVAVLRTEQDIALRGRAHESLELATGKHLPADAATWDEYLHHGDGPPGTAPVLVNDGTQNKFLGIIPVGWK